MLQKISFIIIFIFIFYSTVFANDNYISFLTYGHGKDSILKHQQKEKQIMYGFEYGIKLPDYKRLWVTFEAAYSTHEHTDVDNSFLIKCWGLYKSDSWNKFNIYSGIGVGLSTYKDNDLVKRCPSASLGLRAGLEYLLTEDVSINAEYAYEHNSGMWIDDRGRNIDFVKVAVKYYF